MATPEKKFWRMALLLAAACFPGSVGAEQAMRPQEKNLTYEFKDGSAKVTGTEINADFSRLDQLFGAADLDMLPGSYEKTEEKGWLGVAMKLPSPPPVEPGTGRVLQAIEVARIMPGSAAESAGLLDGDLIAELDGQPIDSPEDKRMLAFRLAISKKHPGEEVRLRVLRAGTWLARTAIVQPYPRVAPVLKPHPEIKKQSSPGAPSLLSGALEKEQLTDEFARLLKGFRDEAGKVVSPMVRHQGSYNPFRLQEVNYLMYHPLDLPVVARNITDQLQGSFNKTRHDLGGLLQTAMSELDMTYAARPSARKVPADFTGYVERLVNAIQYANAERAAVLSVLDAGEIDFLYEAVPEMLMQDPDAVEIKKTADGQKEDEAKMLRLFQLVLKLDLPRLLNAAAGVAQAIDLDTLARLDKKAGKLERYPPNWTVREEENLTVIDTPAGRVLIGGAGNNTYTEDAALILDFGGDDKYFNHAGGSTRAYPFSVVIDLEGNDLYSATGNFAQGAGFFGGGFLIDLKGDDRYMAKNFSQGAGVLGVGILADMAGRDKYTAITASQGAALFGAGILAEGGGDDYYFGNRFVQGFGYIKGFGAIVEVAGNDNYFAGGMYEDFRAPGKSYQSMAQGFGQGMRPWESFVGASGGIGVLLDAEGNDTYVADYFAQGASYWYSLGILDDRKGDDRYISGRYAQGAGIHMSAGILMDGEGEDTYLADFGVSQGCGHDFGIGVLLDNGGNDRYISGTIAQGAGNDNGIGVLSDNGGNNEYHLKSEGQGRGNFEPVRDLGSMGLLFGTGGGNNIYSQGGRSNSLMYKGRWGILLDTN